MPLVRKQTLIWVHSKDVAVAESALGGVTSRKAHIPPMAVLFSVGITGHVLSPVLDGLVMGGVAFLAVSQVWESPSRTFYCPAEQGLFVAALVTEADPTDDATFGKDNPHAAFWGLWCRTHAQVFCSHK